MRLSISSYIFIAAAMLALALVLVVSVYFVLQRNLSSQEQMLKEAGPLQVEPSNANTSYYNPVTDNSLL